MDGRETLCGTNLIVLGRTMADGVEWRILANLALHWLFGGGATGIGMFMSLHDQLHLILLQQVAEGPTHQDIVVLALY